MNSPRSQPGISPEVSLVIKHHPLEEKKPSVNVTEAQEYGFKNSILDKNKTAKIPLCAAKNELYHLGVAFPLYFLIFKNCIIIIIIIFLSNSLYNLATNLYSNDCSVPDHTNTQICTVGSVLTTSMANKRLQKELMDVHEILVLATVIILILMIHIIEGKTRKLILRQDAKEVKPSDFALKVKGFTTEATLEETKEFFSNVLNRRVEIKNVIRIYDTYERVALVRQKSALELDLSHKQSKKKHEKLERQLKAINKRLEHLQRIALRPLAVVIVIFQYEIDAKAVYNQAQIKSSIERAFYKLIKWKSLLPMSYKGQKLRMREAPDPKDMIWEHYGQSNFKRMLFTNFVAFLFILVGFLIMFGIIALRNVIRTHFPKNFNFYPLSQVAAVLLLYVNIRLIKALKS